VKRLVALAALGLAARATAFAQPVTHGGIFFDEIQLETIGPTDLRFFGTFCQPEPKKFCKSIPVLPDPCVTVRDVRTHIDHLTTPSGGLLQGGGTLVVDGKQGSISVAGNVLERGRMRFAGAIPGLGLEFGDATLSEDGLELTAITRNRALALRKDACGNNAPQVTLVAPFGPTFPFGQSVMLSGTISDEDTVFPLERIVFTSNRQGAIPGTRIAGGRTLFTTALQTGNHHVTITVTDSGGLTGQDSLDITIINRPPDVPKIIQPAANASLPTGAPILLRGTAFDPDSGLLPASALAWTAQLSPGAPLVALGTGNELTTTFATAADPVLIRLTATDNASQQSHIDRQLKVVPATGNAPPNVAIREPDPMLQPGPWVGGATVGFVAHYVGDAWDVEDPPNQLQLRWEFVALQAMGGAPDPNPAAPNPAPVAGTLAPDVVFPVGDKFYRVTLTATDSGGLSNSESIEVYVTANVIL
jgi:hypothetical protein